MADTDLMKLKENATDRTLTAISATSIPETTGDYAESKDFTIDFKDEFGNPVEVRASDIGGPDALYQVI
jgi:hypothetical protein